MKPNPKDYANPDTYNTALNEMDWEITATKKSVTSELLGSDYSYLDLGTGFSKTLSAFKRLAAPINPFAIQQGSTIDRVGFAPFVGSRWFMPSPLANDVSFGRLTPSHFDSSKQATLTPPDTSQAVLPIETFGELKVVEEHIPLACVRPLQKFYRCKMINGDDKCQDEANAFLQICPNPVLAEMRNEKLMKEKHRQIQLADYRKAIEVSEYNKERTVANVPANAKKSWGLRYNLRPDTMWADERYSNVTSEEIEEAKARLGEQNKRINARLNPNVKEVPHFDSNKQFVKVNDLPVYVK